MRIRSHSVGRGRALAVLLASLTLAAACSSSSKPSSSSSSSSTTSRVDRHDHRARRAEARGRRGSLATQSTGTPAKYNTVGILKVGPSDAKNVLVLEPGTSAGAAYFVPLAQWIVSKNADWQVWSVERRENLVEDQSELDLSKQGKATATDLYNYYLGYLKDPKITKHMQIPPRREFAFAKQWGMNVAVEDLHRVIGEAEKLGGKVVLGGHSLGGTVVTAYATWDFAGKPGADGLAGLVYIDGGSGSRSISAADATASLQQLNAPDASPWLTFGGIPAPFAGVFIANGSAAVLLAPNEPSLGQTSGLLPKEIVPPVRVEQHRSVRLRAQPHDVTREPRGRAGAPRHRPRPGRTGARMERRGRAHADEPLRRHVLRDRAHGRRRQRVVLPGPAHRRHRRRRQRQRQPGAGVIDVDATMGHDLPKDLLIYAFGAAPRRAARARRRAGARHAVGDPGGQPHAREPGEHVRAQRSQLAYPKNDFFDQLLPFLTKVESAG